MVSAVPVPIPKFPRTADDEPLFSMRAILLAVGRVVKATRTDVGGAMNLVERQVYNVAAKYEQQVAVLVPEISKLIRITKRDVKQIASADADKQLEKLLGSAIATIAEAIENGDAAAAWRLYEQVKGKPQSNVNLTHKGTVAVTHNHYVMQASALAAFEHDAIADNDLIAGANRLLREPTEAPTEDVIDV